MNDLCDRLFRGGNLGAQLKKRDGGTFFKNYLPYSDKVPYDLVVSAYSLFEVGNLDARSKMIDILWRKVAPGGILVLIEQGSNAGYELIIQAREYLLHVIKQEVEYGDEGGYILAPCPHEKFCPRYFESKTPCVFPVKYHELQIGDEKDRIGNENMSFIVFRRGINDLSNKHKWPRIVRGIYKKKGHSTVITCTENGKLETFVSTKKRSGKACYNVFKNCSYGDMLPIDILKSGDVEEVDDLLCDDDDDDNIE